MYLQGKILSIQTSPNKALNTSSIPAKNWELFVNI